MSRLPPAVEVRGLHKTFKIPAERAHRLKERVLHPLRTTRYNELHVLNDVSFEIGRGEFFGIVGVNGSGKSTLLKVLASIYRADSGSVRVAGHITPFIELGVGFNPELTAHDNVLLNGVMMGLTPRQARKRYDAVMDYAGLDEFGELALKNYSSGMQVRLAFSVMLQVPSEILLIDEVLAVGDAAFQEKCIESLTRLHAEGRTIVFVTHAMPLVERFCDRAMMLEDGRIARIGEPAGVTSGYLRSGREDRVLWARDRDERDGSRWMSAEISELSTSDAEGRPRSSVATGERFDVEAALEVRQTIERGWVLLEMHNDQRALVFGVGSSWIDDGASLPSGDRLRMRIEIDNHLVPGDYTLTCTMMASEPSGQGRQAVSEPERLPFTVSGPEREHEGLLMLQHEMVVTRDDTERVPL